MTNQQTDKPIEDRTQVDYTGAAWNYDEERFHGKKNNYLEMIRRRVVLKQVKAVESDMKVLDVGCGTGRGLGYLVSGGFQNLTGLDFTRAMLERAREKLDQQLPSNSITLLQGDAFSLPFESDAFDLVLSMNFIHLFALDRQIDVVKQMHKVCRPGGRIIAEFENLNRGILMSREREQEQHSSTTKLNTYNELKQIFTSDMFDSIHIAGTDIPVAHRFLKYVPPLGVLLESLLHYPPLNRCGGRFIVSARKRII